MRWRENRESHHPGPKELKKSVTPNQQSAIQGKSRRPGLKKLSKKQISLDWPPTPRGCEWRRSDAGLNLWRCWTEWDDDKGKRIKKSRYAGHLSDDAWPIMKEYDHEAFISIVGEAANRLSEEFRDAHTTIPWKQIVGTRNRIIHGYSDVKLDIIWEIAAESIHPLLAELEPLLPKPPEANPGGTPEGGAAAGPS